MTNSEGVGAGTPYPGGIIYVGRHRDASEPFEADDLLDGYPLFDTVTEFVAPRTAGRNRDLAGFNPHDMARDEGPKLLAEKDSLRSIGRGACDCKKNNPPLVAAYVRKGSLWFWVREQRFPAAVRDEVLARRSGSAKAWPAHVEPTGMPHVDLATCRRCGRHWVVLINERSFKLVRTGDPVYGARVAAD